MANNCNPYNCTDREGVTHRMHKGVCVALAKPKTTLRSIYETVRYGAYTVYEDLNRIQRDYPKGWDEVTEALGGEPTQIIQKVNGDRTRHILIEEGKKDKKITLMSCIFIIRRHIDNGLEAPYNYIETHRRIGAFHAGDPLKLKARKVPVVETVFEDFFGDVEGDPMPADPKKAIEAQQENWLDII